MAKSNRNNRRRNSKFNGFPRVPGIKLDYDLKVSLEHISRTQKRNHGRAVTEAQVRDFIRMPIFESTRKNWEKASAEGYLEIFYETYSLTPKGIEVTNPERYFGGYFNNLSDSQKEIVRARTARAIKDTKTVINMSDNPLLGNRVQNYGGQRQNA